MRTSDRELQQRLAVDPREGWRLFMETYTPALLAIIEHAGVRQPDEAMDVYVRVCEHLAEDACARLRKHDPGKGELTGWLAIVVRRVIVDWVRSRKGRRRLFASIKALQELDRKVFDLFYWRGLSPVEIAGALPAPVADVFDALERVERALNDRQRAEMMAMAARVRDPAALEEEPAGGGRDPEETLAAQRMRARVAAALGKLPPEDALIVSMRFIDGLSQAQVERALHTGPIAAERIHGILARLRSLLEGVEA